MVNPPVAVGRYGRVYQPHPEDKEKIVKDFNERVIYITLRYSSSHLCYS